MLARNRGTSCQKISLFIVVSALLVLLCVDRIWVILMGESYLELATVFSSKKYKILDTTDVYVKGTDTIDAVATSNDEDENYCEVLAQHLQGNWMHHFAFFDKISDITLADHSIRLTAYPVTNKTLEDESVKTMYLSEEISWLQGQNVPMNTDPNSPKSWYYGKGKCRGTGYNDVQRGISYLSTIGNQCGCGTSPFQPSHSYWSSNATTNSDKHQTMNKVPIHDSPSLRLAKQFAQKNQTVCFVGDSVDCQFYFALRNNLLRAELLHQQHFNASILNMTSKNYPVHYSTNNTSNDRSKGYRLPDDFWMLAKEIIQSTVTFHDETLHQFRFMYLKHYMWAPWLYEYMETCDVMIMNHALHYSLYQKNVLLKDTEAAITYLANFSASSKDRVAIWRETLPQHFGTPSGHHQQNVQNCVAINEEYRKEHRKQEYILVHEEAFSQLCQSHNTPCGSIQQTCTVNTKSTDLFTVYFYWVANNLTSELDYVKDMDSNVTGSILMWDLFDLFDVPMWHADNNDCTHFCYVPALYEAAFRRLELLLKIAP